MTPHFERLAGTPNHLLGLTVAHAYREFPREACGVWAGERGRDQGFPSHVFRMSNVAEEPRDRFTVDREVQLAVWKIMDGEGLDPVLAYHSHCHGPAAPSQDDIDNHDPGMLMLIVSLREIMNPQISLFMFHGDDYVALDFPY